LIDFELEDLVFDQSIFAQNQTDLIEESLSELLELELDNPIDEDPTTRPIPIVKDHFLQQKFRR
jgi:hypothetical protein